MFGYVIFFCMIILGCVNFMMEFLYYVEVLLGIVKEIIVGVKGEVNV